MVSEDRCSVKEFIADPLAELFTGPVLTEGGAHKDLGQRGGRGQRATEGQ